MWMKYDEMCMWGLASAKKIMVCLMWMGYDGFINGSYMRSFGWHLNRLAGCAQIPSWASLQVKGIYVVNCMKPAIRNIGWRSSSYGSGASAAVGNLNQANITQVKWRGDMFDRDVWEKDWNETSRVGEKKHGGAEFGPKLNNHGRITHVFNCIQLYSGDADGDWQ